jgi:hypothetical protein
MVKCAAGFLIAIVLLGGCKKQAATDETSAASAILQYSDPPKVEVGISVEQAYAAIPHRRTVWAESGSTISAEEKAYLTVIFQVVDQAVAVRVAGLQNFSSERFESANIEAEYDRLITFARTMPVPKNLDAYHHDILEALTSEKRFFEDWRAQRSGFAFSVRIANHPSVQRASAASRAAYGILISKYPQESQANKDAFFDYHCALDFL